MFVDGFGHPTRQRQIIGPLDKQSIWNEPQILYRFVRRKTRIPSEFIPKRRVFCFFLDDLRRRPRSPEFLTHGVVARTVVATGEKSVTGTRQRMYGDGLPAIDFRRPCLIWIGRKQTLYRRNKYEGGTSDATTSSSLIVLSIFMTFEDFPPSKTPIFVV